MKMKEEGDWIYYRPQDRGPNIVKRFPRLSQDIKALIKLSASDLLPVIFPQAKRMGNVYYRFGDAWGSGFGQLFLIIDEVVYEYRKWSTEEVKTIIFNWKEATNLLWAIENLYIQGVFFDSKLFMFTNNQTIKNCFGKISSSSENLFCIVLAPEKLEMKYQFNLHVIYISGVQMKEQGTDGISQKDNSWGVMAGRSMLEYIPLHLGTFKRNPRVRNWIEDVTKRKSLVY